MRKLVIGFLVFVVIALGLYLYLSGAGSRAAHRVHYELANGKLIFDFPEPTVPKIYQVSYQYIPDPEFWTRFQRDFFSYCRRVKGLKELPEHRIENPRSIAYYYGHASLIYDKSTGYIYFQNSALSSNPRYSIVDLPKAIDFIKKYGGGLDDAFVPEVERGTPEVGGGIIMFKPSIDGVKVSGKSGLDGVNIIQTKKGILEFSRADPCFTIGEVIPPAQIQTPLDTIKVNSMDDYFNFLAYSREQPVRFIKCNLIYVIRTSDQLATYNQLEPAWEFVEQRSGSNQRVFYSALKDGPRGELK